MRTLTLNVITSSYCRHHCWLVNVCRRRKDHRAHRLYWIFHDDSWMSLFYPILSVVHADNTIHIRLLHETKVFLFNRWRRRNQRRDILDNSWLLLKWREEALLLLLLSFHVRYLMTHLQAAKLLIDYSVQLYSRKKTNLFMPISIVRISTPFTFAIDASFWVDITRTTLPATGEFSWRCSCVPTPTASSLLRIVWVWIHRCCDYVGLLLDWRPLKIRVYQVFSL